MNSINSPGPENFASLIGKTVLVTGASTGIGRAIAIELARAGADVLLHFAKSVGAIEQVADAVQQLGRKSTCLQYDFHAGNIESFADLAWNASAEIDVLVNNAGVDLLTGENTKLTFDEKLDHLLDVDVKGSVHLSRFIGAKMQKRGWGCILNIGWDQADRGMEGDSAELFSTAKNAIMGFTRSLAVSLAPEVRVNCIAPGWIQTAWGEHANETWQQRVLAETPLKRWGQPEDIAKLARFLVSSEADYLTGQVINANGGAIR